MPVPDPRVEKLEDDIAKLRDQFGDFMHTTTRTLERVEDSLGKVNGHVADVLYEMGGAPDHKFREKDRPTIRSRLHKIENESAAAAIAHEALRRTKEQAFTRGQKIGLFAFAAVGAGAALLRLVGVGG